MWPGNSQVPDTYSVSGPYNGSHNVLIHIQNFCRIIIMLKLPCYNANCMLQYNRQPPAPTYPMEGPDGNEVIATPSRARPTRCYGVLGRLSPESRNHPKLGFVAWSCYRLHTIITTTNIIKTITTVPPSQALRCSLTTPTLPRRRQP